MEKEISSLKYHGIDNNRFSGGAVGFLGYEYANRVEKTVPLPDQDQLNMPILFMLTEVVLIFDHARQTLTICANAFPEDRKNLTTKHVKINDTLETLAMPSKLEATLEVDEELDIPKGNFSKEIRKTS